MSFDLGDAGLKPEIITTTALEAQERAAIDMQIATAKKYPRDIERAKNRMIQYATLDQDTAIACFYTLPRKEDGKIKNIEGPSVRLAEIAVSCWGNLRAQARVIDNDGKKITCQGICMDLETNVAISVESQRRITNKHGATYSEDMQITTANAASAIAFRNAVFKVIPGAIVKPVYEAARACAIGKGTKETKWAKATEAFHKGWHVTAAELLAFVEKKGLQDLTDDDFARLAGLFTALRDGDTTVEEAFAEIRKPGTQEKADAVKDRKLADDAKGSTQNSPSNEGSKQEESSPPAGDEKSPSAEAERAKAAARVDALQKYAQQTREPGDDEDADKDKPQAKDEKLKFNFGKK